MPLEVIVKNKDQNKNKNKNKSKNKSKNKTRHRKQYQYQNQMKAFSRYRLGVIYEVVEIRIRKKEIDGTVTTRQNALAVEEKKDERGK